MVKSESIPYIKNTDIFYMGNLVKSKYGTVVLVSNREGCTSDTAFNGVVVYQAYNTPVGTTTGLFCKEDYKQYSGKVILCTD